MRTNIEIDDDLLAEAMEAAGQTTKKATVEEALRRLVRIIAGGEQSPNLRWDRLGRRS